MNSRGDIVCDKCVYQQSDGECHKLIGQRANKSKCPDICREAWPGERVTTWITMWSQLGSGVSTVNPADDDLAIRMSVDLTIADDAVFLDEDEDQEDGS